MNLNNYISMARPNHWFKAIFMLPGMVFGLIELRPNLNEVVLSVIVGVFASCLIASANYVLNEILDAECDRNHPTKKQRAAAQNMVCVSKSYFFYFGLLIAGFVLGWSCVNVKFFISLVIFALFGLIYNVPPIRAKDIVYIDVLVESFNNVIRLFLGWYLVTTVLIPPAALILSMWMAGAFLMAAKRFSEYRFIGHPKQASLYRKSFQHYSERKLIASCLFYAISFSLFFGIFLFKYKKEYILVFPFIALIFSWYMYRAFDDNSVAQNPQSLYKDKLLFVLMLFLCAMFVGLSFVDIDILNTLLDAKPY